MPAPKRLRDGLRIYAIGDIHGRPDLLEKALGDIESDIAARPVPKVATILLGDCIDRGPRSRETLDLIIERIRDVRLALLCLKGNHEAMMLAALDDIDDISVDRWLANGGAETVMSYDVDPGRRLRRRPPEEVIRDLRRSIPAEHLDLLRALPSMIIEDDYLFVHAGIRPGTPLKAQAEADLLWIRDEFLHSNLDFGKRVVHGHSPVSAPDVRPNRINIDTGAFLTNRLTCAVIEGEQVAFL